MADKSDKKPTVYERVKLGINDAGLKIGIGYQEFQRQGMLREAEKASKSGDHDLAGAIMNEALELEEKITNNKVALKEGNLNLRPYMQQGLGKEQAEKSFAYDDKIRQETTLSTSDKFKTIANDFAGTDIETDIQKRRDAEELKNKKPMSAEEIAEKESKIEEIRLRKDALYDVYTEMKEARSTIDSFNPLNGRNFSKSFDGIAEVHEMLKKPIEDISILDAGILLKEVESRLEKVKKDDKSLEEMIEGKKNAILATRDDKVDVHGRAEPTLDLDALDKEAQEPIVNEDLEELLGPEEMATVDQAQPVSAKKVAVQAEVELTQRQIDGGMTAEYVKDVNLQIRAMRDELNAFQKELPEQQRHGHNEYDFIIIEETKDIRKNSLNRGDKNDVEVSLLKAKEALEKRTGKEFDIESLRQEQAELEQVAVELAAETEELQEEIGNVEKEAKVEPAAENVQKMDDYVQSLEENGHDVLSIDEGQEKPRVTVRQQENASLEASEQVELEISEPTPTDMYAAELAEEMADMNADEAVHRYKRDIRQSMVEELYGQDDFEVSPVERIEAASKVLSEKVAIDLPEKPEEGLNLETMQSYTDSLISSVEEKNQQIDKSMTMDLSDMR